jgi:hypothetical protein
VSVVLKGFVVTLFPISHLPRFISFPNIPINITTSLQMHQTLRLRAPDIKHRSGIPQNLQNIRIAFCHSANPAHEPSVPIQTFHANMLFDADWEAVKGTDGLFVFCKVGIEEGGAFDGALGEEFCDAVCLCDG